jgi:hypothetical protein
MKTGGGLELAQDDGPGVNDVQPSYPGSALLVSQSIATIELLQAAKGSVLLLGV